LLFVSNITSHLNKHQTHPVLGTPLTPQDLINIHFHSNAQGQYHCPLTFKVFNDNSHIVFIKTSGNVFSYDAIEQFNIKPGIWNDLLTNEPFKRGDVVTIQGPAQDQKRWTDQNASKKRSASSELPVPDPKKPKKEFIEEKDVPRSKITSGECSASFTSTSMKVVTQNKGVPLSDEQLRGKLYSKVRAMKNKAKAYVNIETSKGSMLFQLHCDKAPKTCHNFVLLCQKNYFNGTKFHRLIQGFMVQGGDPTGKGTGGTSAWGKSFSDEFSADLKHNKRGILSMANSGPNTNGSQL
jgi:peptidyl-prolyl cis-trans isomerase-like protein 2